MNFDYEDKSLYQIEALATSLSNHQVVEDILFKILNINILDKSDQIH